MPKPKRRRRCEHCGDSISATPCLPRLLIAEEVAVAIRKSEKTVYKWAQQRRLPSINLDGSILFDPDAIRSWIDDHRMDMAA
jgi:predicted DNA-binding transcriptional regulator AlpA